jgi:hypothetical protein
MNESAINRGADQVPAVVSLMASTATQLTTVRTSGARGVVITADPANTSDIFIGTTTGVTNAAAWFAYVRPAFGPVILPISDASQLYLYSTGTAQKFGWSVI